MAKKGKGSYVKGGKVSSDTDITMVNNRAHNIAGDLETFDTENWNADAYLIGGSVQGQSPFNVYEIKDLKSYAKGFLDGEELQHGR